MARVLILFLLVEALLVLAKATNVASSATPAASTPSSNPKRDAAESPENKIRRLGKHRHKDTRSSAAPSLSPCEAPLAKDNMHYSEGVSSMNQENSTSQVQELKINKENHRRHHHSVDKSVAGGGIILGGLATAFLAAIFCYIRATRRKGAEPSSPTSPTSATSKV